MKFMQTIMNNKIFKTIYNTIKILICVVLATYIMFVVYQRFTGNAAIFGYRVFTVASGSMVPIYNVNDVIIVKDVDSKTLNVGDDIAYKGERGGFEGLIITHRIIEIEEDSNGKLRLITQGVNNDYEDPSITEEQILGKVCGKVFLINSLNHIVKSVWGFFFLIFLPLTLVIILEILETIFEGKIERNEIRRYGELDDEEMVVEHDVLENEKTEETKRPDASIDKNIAESKELNDFEVEEVVEEELEDDSKSGLDGIKVREEPSIEEDDVDEEII